MSDRQAPRCDRFRVLHCTEAADPSPYRLVDPEGGDVEPVKAFLDAAALRGLSSATLRTYAFALRSAWSWLTEHGVTLKELTQAHLLDFVRFLHEQGRATAPRSVNLRLLVLRRCYQYHLGHPLPRTRDVQEQPGSPFCRPIGLGYAPRAKRRPPGLHLKVPRKCVVPLDRKEVGRFFASLRTWRDLALTSLMLFCGLRVREVLGLALEDLELDQDQIWVHGKGDKDRVLPLAPEVSSALCRYLRHERPRKTAHQALFLVLKGPRRGCPMTPAGLRSIFRHHRKQSGVARAHPHRFRHTFAVDMVRSGISLPALMRLMGHAHIEMTLRYVNLSVEDVREEFLAALRRRNQPHD